MKNNKEYSRTKNSFLNIGSNAIVMLIKTVFSFVTRTVFIYCLGKESLGLNGLFTNILSMLSLADLGISSAISFSLYSPLANKNDRKISSLMTFYRRAYNIIGVVILILGVALVPILPVFIKDISTVKNAYIIYILYLLNTASTYFISYKEILITADQKKFRLFWIDLIAVIMLNIIQIIILVTTSNFILYLIAQFVIQLAQKIATNIYVTKMYDRVNFNSSTRIGSNSRREITKNIKAMFFHKIGDYCVNGTDNLIISSMIGVSTVGVYSNYLMIVNMLNNFFNIIYNNLTSSLGNLIVKDPEKKQYDVYKKMDYASFCIYGLTFIVLFNILNDFITIWIGNDYIVDNITVLFICINFYLAGMRIAPTTMKNAAGMYDIDKFTPLFQAGINLVVSIVLAKRFGLLGVIIGTTISSIFLPSWQRPYILYKKILRQNPTKYLKRHLKQLLIVSGCSAIIYFLFISLKIDLVLAVILKTSLSIFLFVIANILFFGDTSEFEYLKKMIIKVKSRIVK